MQNNVDFSQFGTLDKEVLKKTRRLGKYYTYCQINRQKVELSLFYLWKLIPEQDNEALSRISQVFSEVENLQNAQLIWARLCVAARFFYHDHPKWQNLLFSKLEERIILPDLTTDIQTATALLDTYFTNLSELKKGAATKPATAPQQPSTPASKSKPKPEEVFHSAYQKTADYHRLLDVLEHEKNECSDCDWARHALEIYEYPNSLINPPSTFKKWLPIFCAMFGREVEYRDPCTLRRTESKTKLAPFLM
jgi:hypothetical protein